MARLSWSDSPFNWPATPELDVKSLNSPQPCSHGIHCTYKSDKCCAFVHPGEEGTGRRLFPARTVKNATGEDVWQAATVRLIGSPSFYERRRLKMSWPEWCAKKGIVVPPRAPKAEVVPKAAVVAHPVPLSAIFTSQPQEQMWASAEVLQMQAQAMVQAMAQAQAMLRAQAQARDQRWAQESAQEKERNFFGNALMEKLTPYLDNLKSDFMAGTPEEVWPTNMTAGKVTGMLLEGLDKSQLEELLVNEEKLEELAGQALDVLKEAWDVTHGVKA
jgi:molecular chaperone GrpE (heat shock protein)